MMSRVGDLSAALSWVTLEPCTQSLVGLALAFGSEMPLLLGILPVSSAPSLPAMGMTLPRPAAQHS